MNDFQLWIMLGVAACNILTAIHLVRAMNRADLMLMRASKRLAMLGDALMTIINETSKRLPDGAETNTCDSLTPSSNHTERR